jgi:protein gp37
VKNTKIEWCHHTFNPWIGCTRVSPACEHCYAAVSTPARAMGIKWGAGEPRHRTSAENWLQPLAWNREAEKLGIRYSVFCASLADIFDNEVPQEWRIDLLRNVVLKTPNLDWLFLTKRIGNADRMMALALPCEISKCPDNIWIGATVVNQEEVDRDVPKLLATSAGKRFLSIEPLLNPVDLTNIATMRWRGAETLNALTGELSGMFGDPCNTRLPGLDWVIVGGESGAGARPMLPAAARSLRDQCAAANVPFMFKQWGDWAPVADLRRGGAPLTEAGDIVMMTWPEGTDGFIRTAYPMRKVGKKRAGRLLDGFEHNGVPA